MESDARCLAAGMRRGSCASIPMSILFVAIRKTMRYRLLPINVCANRKFNLRFAQTYRIIPL